MGTSADHKGSKPSTAPLIAPHADLNPGAPQPTPDPNRFRRFRTAMRKYSSTGNSDARERALGHYSRDVRGGGTLGARNFGAVSRAGAAAIAGLSALANGGTGVAATGHDLTAALGKSIDIAAQIIADAIAPSSESRDNIRVAMERAICAALEGEHSLEQSQITDDFLASVLLGYLTEAVFLDVWREAGDSTDGAELSDTAIHREDELREVCSVAVDAELSKLGVDELSKTTTTDLVQIQQNTVGAVLTYWEGLADD